MPTSSAPLVYLAGPMVFYPDPEATFDIMKAICEEEGLEGVAPIDGQASLEGLPPGRELYTRIVEADFKLMDECDAALVCLTPVHGDVEMDTGTAVEIGYLHARRKPMSGWMSPVESYGDRIRARFGPTVVSAANGIGATSGVERDVNGLLVHSNELAQHGMAQIPIEMSGGAVIQERSWTRAFRLAARNLATRFPEVARDVPFVELDFETVPEDWGSTPAQYHAVAEQARSWMVRLGMDAYEDYWKNSDHPALSRIHYLTATNVWRNVATLLRFTDNARGEIIDDICYRDFLKQTEVIDGIKRILRREGIYDGRDARRDDYIRTDFQNDVNWLLGTPVVSGS